MATDILYPVGRLVGGSLYHAQVRQQRPGDPPPKIDPKTNLPAKQYGFAVAYAKTPGQHWANSEWGAKIWAEAHQGYSNGETQHPSFAWKILDGDSMIPNKAGKKPAENDGYPGHWVVWFGGTYQPKTCNVNGSEVYGPTDERIKLGHFVQVKGSVAANGSSAKPSQSPGVYQNYQFVAHTAFGPEIVASSIDPTTIGFGAAALPAGASATPLAGIGGHAVPTVAPGVPPVSTAVAPPLSAPPASIPPVANTAITPNPAFLQPPAGNAPPAAPIAAAPPVQMPSPVPAPTPMRFVMMAAAGQFTREQYHAQGWTDEQLVASGYMHQG